MKKIMMLLILMSTLFAGEQQCKQSINLYLKYVNRVLSAVKLGTTPSGVNMNLAIDYGVDAISDCEGVLSPENIGVMKDGINWVIAYRNSVNNIK